MSDNPYESPQVSDGLSSSAGMRLELSMPIAVVTPGVIAITGRLIQIFAIPKTAILFHIIFGLSLMAAVSISGSFLLFRLQAPLWKKVIAVFFSWVGIIVGTRVIPALIEVVR